MYVHRESVFVAEKRARVLNVSVRESDKAMFECSQEKQNRIAVRSVDMSCMIETGKWHWSWGSEISAKTYRKSICYCRPA